MKLFIFAILLSVFTTNSFAKGTADIVSGSANANLNMSQNYDGDDYHTRVNLGVSYDRAFAAGLQFGADIGANFGSNYHDYTLLVGPGYNFQANDLENSYFVLFRGGVVISKFYGETETDGMITLEGGKRFKFIDSVSYVPGIKLAQNLSSHSGDPAIIFNIFKFSILF